MVTGIGGVHRGGESSMDVSADLTELGRTSVATVCAGVKSVLDIPRTLEYLETQVRPPHPPCTCVPYNLRIFWNHSNVWFEAKESGSRSCFSENTCINQNDLPSLFSIMFDIFRRRFVIRQ